MSNIPVVDPPDPPPIQWPMTLQCGVCRRLGTAEGPDQLGRSGWAICPDHTDNPDPLDPTAPIPEPITLTAQGGEEEEGNPDEPKPNPEPEPASAGPEPGA